MNNFVRNTFEKKSLLTSVKEMAPLIAKETETIDRERMVPLSLIQTMRELGLFRLSWPHQYGGTEVDPLTQIELFEEISKIDGSVGWVGTFGALTGFTAARLEEGAVRTLFSSPDVVAAGQYAPVGRGEVVPGGFKLTGHWSFGSGCRHAQVMTGGFAVYEDGSPRLVGGQPETRMAVFPKDQCEILYDTWDTVGLRGTGSHDYKVKDLFVPYEHTFDYFDKPRFEGPLFTYAPLFLFSHAPMPLGIARGAIDAVIELGSQKRIWPSGKYLKEEGSMQESIAEAEAALGAARSYVFSAINELWETLMKGSHPSMRQRALFRLSLIHCTRVAKEVVALMFDAAASSAIQHGNPMERRMRDILTLSQHRVVQTKMYRPAGQVLLGLESRDPFF